MTEKISATPIAFKVSELTPITIQDSPNVQIKFHGQQVDNSSEIKKNIKGSLVIKKKTSKEPTFNNGEKFTRKDISPYNMVELSFDTKQTYALGKGLMEYYMLFSGKHTNPYEEVSYIKTDDQVQQLKKILESNEKLIEIINNIDTKTLNVVLNINNFEKLKNDIEANLNNNDEGFWQSFFTEHSWALSQMFCSPYMIFNGARYVGGKSIDNKNGKETDFIMQNEITKNISIVEIKTPETILMASTLYRQNVYHISEDLSGGINQLLSQKQELYENYATLRIKTIENCGTDFQALNIKSILLIGKISNLNSRQMKQFEIYRNELQSVEILTFDELLLKISNAIQLLSK